MSVQFEKYVDQFKKAAIRAYEIVDYSNKISICKHNKQVDKHRKIAKKIQMNYPDRISDFSNLLNDDNWSIRICCAVCIVEIMNPSPIDKKKAIDAVIQYIEKTDDIVERHGFEIWLKQHQNH